MEWIHTHTHTLLVMITRMYPIVLVVKIGPMAEMHLMLVQNATHTGPKCINLCHDLCSIGCYLTDKETLNIMKLKLWDTSCNMIQVECEKAFHFVMISISFFVLFSSWLPNVVVFRNNDSCCKSTWFVLLILWQSIYMQILPQFIKWNLSRVIHFPCKSFPAIIYRIYPSLRWWKFLHAGSVSRISWWRYQMETFSA